MRIYVLKIHRVTTNGSSCLQSEVVYVNFSTVLKLINHVFLFPFGISIKLYFNLLLHYIVEFWINPNYIGFFVLWLLHPDQMSLH